MVLLAKLEFQSDLGLSMLFDARLRPAYSPARVNRALVMTGRIGTRQGCMGLSHIHNEYPYQRYEQQNQEFTTGLESHSVQTIYVTAVNVLRVAPLTWVQISADNLLLNEISCAVQASLANR